MEINIPITIEKQLENYATQKGHSDRHETLWHAWHQNKRWISQLLQVTLSSFPTYSRHDESHALSVLNNIEMLLGQERIAQLSATDCFVLLHTVYIHDIGMCITQQDRKDIIYNEKFIDMIEQLEKDGEESVVNAIKNLKRTDYETGKNNKEEHIENLKQLYRDKLDVYYAIIELISHYRRSEHGDVSKKRLYEWTLESDKLGAGFSMAGIPLRIFLAIARSAQMHTCNNFEEIKKLPRKDGGYASDYYHPRFISVLLMLGDLLDMDNDRFHPMVFEFVEDFPESSRNHYDKHRAIRRLSISPDVIEIEADCKSQNALRLVRKECDMLVEILHDAGYMWTSICPKGFQGSLPSLKEVNLYLNGKQIPEELVTAQFNISQQKAFSILEGSNLYDGRYVFLREFLQNAIDATKMQYWYDYLGTAAYYSNTDLILKKSPNEMNKDLSLNNYPIEIEMQLQKRDKQGKITEITDEDDKNIREGNPGTYEYGVLVSIKDFGTGIDKDRILAISQVGNSRAKDRKTIQKMPKWLRPTAEFGVGLQSAFLLTNNFKCSTHTRSGERYEITFSSGSSAQYQGYINVIPRERFEKKYETYGTCFEVFVPLEKKYLHSESICTWSGSDPFSEDYDNTRIFRHTAELISQMALYLDGILGELLFPIKLSVKDDGKLKLALNQNEDNRLNKIEYQLSSDSESKKRISWIFHVNDSNFLSGETENAIFALEYDTARLHIWAKELNAACIVSGANLMKQQLKHNKSKTLSPIAKGVNIFYKGIQLQCKCMEEIEIFEFIDLKGSLERSHINISRRGFTSEGEKYFEEEIYKKLLNLVKEVLQFINKQEESLRKLSENINTKINSQLIYNSETAQDIMLSDAEYHARIENLMQQILSLTFLAHLAVKDDNNELSQLGKSCGTKKDCVWQENIKAVNQNLNKKENKIIKEELKKSSILFDIQGYECSDSCQVQAYTILDLFSSENHFGILQKRKDPLDTWVEYIISVNQDLYKLFDQRMLSEISNTANIKKLDEKIESVVQEIFKNTRELGTSGSSVPDGQKYQQQFLLKWLLKNIPTIGIFSNEDSKNRFSILGNYIYPYIYTNLHHKRQLVQRILETAKEKKYNRFSTYAWQGRHFLSLKNVPFSCYFSKRGFLNKIYMHKVIIPIEGKTLCKIQSAIEHVEDLEHVKNMKLLAEMLDFKSFYGKLLQKNLSTLTKQEYEIRQKIIRIGQTQNRMYTALGLEVDEFLQDTIKSTKPVKKISAWDAQDYFNKLRAFKNEWFNCYLNVIDIYMDTYLNVRGDIDQKKVKALKDQNIFSFISKGWFYMNTNIQDEILPRLQTTKLKEDYIRKCETDSALKATNQRIINHIQSDGHYHIQPQQIEQCFKAFTVELFEIAEKIENDKACELLKSVKKRETKET